MTICQRNLCVPVEAESRPQLLQYNAWRFFEPA